MPPPMRRFGFEPWVENSPWRRKWQPTSEFSPGKFHGQGSLEGYSPWGCKRVKHDLATKWQVFHFINAAAAKSLQSCPTLCDPMDSSPPGSSVHRILQARTLEWAAISFSHYTHTHTHTHTSLSIYLLIGTRIVFILLQWTQRYKQLYFLISAFISFR